jgi:hypothetical protein
MKTRIVNKMSRLLFVGFLLTGMTYASSTLATKHVSAATCDCSSLLSAAAVDCGQRFGDPLPCLPDCFESGGELWFVYQCCGDPYQLYVRQQHCQP